MPHSILMMHPPSGSSRGHASEMHIESRELVRMRDYLSLLTSEATGQPYDRVSSAAAGVLFWLQQRVCLALNNDDCGALCRADCHGGKACPP